MNEPLVSQPALAELITRLRGAELDWDAETIADVIWLSRYLEGETVQRPLKQAQPMPPPLLRQTETAEPAPDLDPDPGIGVYSDNAQPSQAQSTETRRGIPFQAPTAPALRKTLALGRALRPLMRKVDSYTREVLDEAATAEQTAEQGFCMTVVRPAQERWLEVALVIEESATSVLWEETIRDFRQVLERQGAFRTITVWHLQTAQGEINLLARSPQRGESLPSRHPKELIDASGRRLILLVSDCISAVWRSGALHDRCLSLWAAHGPVAIVQVLPGKLWSRTVLSAALEVQLGAWSPGVTNDQLLLAELPIGAEQRASGGIKIPVVTLEPKSLTQWAKMVAGWGESWATGYWFDEGWQTLQLAQPPAAEGLTAEQLVQRFMTTASELARRLAGLMALVPVSLPIIYLLQETLLPESTPLHLAEIFISGLVERDEPLPQATDSDTDGSSPANTTPKRPTYDFVPQVRELLMDSVPLPLKETVLNRVSQYIGEKLNRSIYSFTALLQLEQDLGETGGDDLLKFATLTKQVLQRMGGDYAALVDNLEPQPDPPPPPPPPPTPFPPLQPITFDYAQLVETDAPPEPASNLELFDFTIATLEQQTRPQQQQDQQPSLWDRILGRRTDRGVEGRIAPTTTEWVIRQRAGQARRRIERLNGPGRSGASAKGLKQPQANPQELNLEMVYIPGGTFEMGSPEDELERMDREGPQHSVTVPSFLMSRYLITQAQWRVVAMLERVERDLKLDPSRFKGDNRPVEQVSWYDAVEFCARLSRLTQREYRLPTEAEWEYACRAGSTTPFHFGETITPEVANYDGNYAYNNGPKGENRKKTTSVDHFDVANAFGLCDMHCNVYEWCQDHWHDNYEGAPGDGSAWLTENEAANRVIRGGSWVNVPWNCRSANRGDFGPGNDDSLVGFRVCCPAPRTS